MVRQAAGVVAAAPLMTPGERRHAEGVIDGWLVAHGQLTADNGTSPPRLNDGEEGAPSSERSSQAELRRGLERFEAGLRAAGLRQSTISAYVLGCSLFVRWLSGDYVPPPRRGR